MLYKMKLRKHNYLEFRYITFVYVRTNASD